MNGMYESYNAVIKVVDGVFDTYIPSSSEDEYIAHTNRASFTLNAPMLFADLDRIASMSKEDIEGFVPRYIRDFGSAYKQSFMTSSGFGEATADRYAAQAMSSMMEVIDSYLAIARQ